MVEQRVRELAESSIGTVIPKPKAKEAFRIKGLGVRRGGAALIYAIPSHTGKKPYQKGIAMSEFQKAYIQLTETRHFTSTWFNRALPACAKEGSCNFTSLGGVFELLGLAEYSAPGEYKLKGRS